MNKEIKGAGLGSRFCAYLLDGTLVSLLWSVISVVITMSVGVEEILASILVPEYGKASLEFKILCLSLPVSAFLYYFLQEAGGRRASLGKRAAKIMVADKDGHPAKGLDVLVRNIVKFLPTLLGMLFFHNDVILTIAAVLSVVDILVLLFNKNKRALHDIIASTVIISEADKVTAFAGVVPELNISLPNPPAHTEESKTVAPMSKKTLLCTSGQYESGVFPLDAPLVLGRDGSVCNVIFENETKGVSKKHCKVEAVGEKVFVTDLNSSYGTYVNGRKIGANVAEELQSGDVIYIGKNEKFMVR